MLSFASLHQLTFTDIQKDTTLLRNYTSIPNRACFVHYFKIITFSKTKYIAAETIKPRISNFSENDFYIFVASKLDFVLTKFCISICIDVSIAVNTSEWQCSVRHVCISICIDVSLTERCHSLVLTAMNALLNISLFLNTKLYYLSDDIHLEANCLRNSKMASKFRGAK